MCKQSSLNAWLGKRHLRYHSTFTSSFEKTEVHLSSIFSLSDTGAMKRVFGKKKQSAPAPSLDDASKGLNGRIDQMDSKIADLENELRVFKDKIKKTKSPAAKKQLQKRAMEVLKRKRMYEQQRDQVSAQAFNIDQTNFSLESAKASVETVAAMKGAHQSLKHTLRKDLDIDDIDDLADDMAELMDDFNDINEAVSLAHIFSQLRSFTSPHSPLFSKQNSSGATMPRLMTSTRRT